MGATEDAASGRAARSCGSVLFRPALLTAAVLVAAFAVSSATAATTPTRPVYDAQGRLVQTPFAPVEDAPKLTEGEAMEAFLANPKVRDWVRRYPESARTTNAEFDNERRDWKAGVWDRRAGQIATGFVDDTSGVVTEAWTGPQVAWKMARGYPGAFGGRELESPVIWLGLCAVFLLGLFDWRRLRSARNLDVLALLSFSVSLWFFNEGEIFTSVPLAYPPLIYLLVRMVWITRRGPTAVAPSVWPVWLLAAVLVFLAGFRIGLNVRTSNVIDVGYASVIGAHRIANGEMPYGHMPVEGDREKCGQEDAEGRVRERIQTNGRCESANERGDTYGPVTYQAYVPGFALFGWSGRWDELPAAHATAIAFDLITMLGLLLVGLRFGGNRLAVTLAFAWAAYPFTQYASNSNTNDAIMPALLVFGFWLVTSPWSRGVFLALAAWSKFAALLLVPLWASFGEAPRALSLKARFAAAFALGTLGAFWILLLEPDPLHAARVFWDRTLGWQVGRDSPFSIWGWGQYHAAGIPDLGAVHPIAVLLLIAGAAATFFWPRRKTVLQLAALTAAILIGFELTLTHWFYLYIPWFLPFVAYASFARDERPDAVAPG
jgi:hypothetical protein